MTVYNTFISRLKMNYAVASVLTIIAIGSLIILSPLHIDSKEYFWLFSVLFLSLVLMLSLEWLVFTLQIRPIRVCFEHEIESFSALQNVYLRTHRLPSLAVKRILGPHLFGMLLPACGLGFYFIHIGKLSIPYYYVTLAILGVVLVVGMRAMIEFYLTSYAIRPLLNELCEWSIRLFGKELTLGGRVLISIRRKLRWSFFMIGAFPILLYSLFVQLQLGNWSMADNTYWINAVFILIVGLGFAFIGSRLLTREIELPIQHLYERMGEVKIGNLRTGAFDLFSDEFSRLVSGFNHMLRGIKVQAARNNQLLESYFATLAAALDARDPYTAGHSLRVAEYAVNIGILAKLPDDQLHDLRKAALLHDIGKIGIRDDVLLKDGRLTDEEWEQIKQHPVLGESILKQIEPMDAMAPFLPGVRSHHERYDGQGYPDGLQGDEIPLFGRIIAVADAFDAMTSDRPYRKGMDKSTAIGILEEGRGTQWDPLFADLFIEAYRKHLKS
ncbi:HAMP domain-containing protein [Fontibacillus panacisegetis]|uniref:HAMP domain-containing protein n=1 Tax=Fontibacillus panacisegetis TaxID=670482 RepID=A0A1G7S8J0_9BACL|nr:HD domain-containing phosphohydrolase [Fontibacillus panacisegetis]SDG19365.1 HAMP domain-containing protein [Fontibacillus panacisegetis]